MLPLEALDLCFSWGCHSRTNSPRHDNFVRGFVLPRSQGQNVHAATFAAVLPDVAFVARLFLVFQKPYLNKKQGQITRSEVTRTNSVATAQKSTASLHEARNPVRTTGAPSRKTANHHEGKGPPSPGPPGKINIRINMAAPMKPIPDHQWNQPQGLKVNLPDFLHRFGCRRTRLVPNTKPTSTAKRRGRSSKLNLHRPSLQAKPDHLSTSMSQAVLPATAPGQARMKSLPVPAPSPKSKKHKKGKVAHLHQAHKPLSKLTEGPLEIALAKEGKSSGSPPKSPAITTG